MGLRTELVTDLDRAGEEVPAWHSLAEQADLPFATPGWMLAFARYVYEPSSLRLVLVKDGTELVGVAPFYFRRPRWAAVPTVEYRLLSSEASCMIGLLAAPSRESEVAAAIATALRDTEPFPAAVALNAVEASTPWARLLQDGWSTPRPTVFRRMLLPAPAVTLKHDHEEWLAERTGHFRSSIGSFTRKIERRGGRMRCSRTLTELDSDLDALFRLHDARRQAFHASSTMTERMRVAVRAAARDLFPRNSVRLLVVETDDGVVAAFLQYCAGGRMSGFASGIDPGWEKLSLGLIMLERVVRDAHDLGLRVVDLGLGDAAYKRRFADHEVPVAWYMLAARDVGPVTVLRTHGTLSALGAARYLKARAPAVTRFRRGRVGRAQGGS